MRRRTNDAEIGFGSDSFLDIIANIVGVLIILMVVAGVQASKAPVTPPVADEPNAPAEPAPVADLEPPPDPELQPTPSVDAVDEIAAVEIVEPTLLPPPLPLHSATLPPAPPPVFELSPELVLQQQGFHSEIALLQNQQQVADATVRTLQGQHHELREHLDAAADRLTAATSLAKTRHGRLTQLTLALQNSAGELQRLQSRVTQAEAEKSPVKTLKHRVTPVSRVVRGEELHFRLLNNRVAPVPIDDLADRLRPQIERQKEWLVKYRRHQGRVGPVGGFSMQYVVERQATSTIEELRGGRGMIRIAVSQWKIVAEPELKTESASEAMHPRSHYVRSLRMANPNSTLTFWVYPDSFAIYRALREFAYDDGFTVAARPLPFDVPIAGSPRGSRSAGQ